MSKDIKKAIIGAIMIFAGFSIVLIPKEFLSKTIGTGFAFICMAILVVAGIFLASSYINNLTNPNNPWNKFK
jgi:hypothetical protein